MTVVVGLDISLTACGVAALKPPHLADSPHAPLVSVVGAKGHRGDTLVQRAQRLGDQTRRIWAALPGAVRLVVVESLPPQMPAHGAMGERTALWWAVVRLLCARGIPVAEVHPSTLKLWATGDGHADKATMVAAMRALWPAAAIRDHNCADATALASLGAQHLGWCDPELPHHIAPRVQWPPIVQPREEAGAPGHSPTPHRAGAVAATAAYRDSGAQ